MRDLLLIALLAACGGADAPKPAGTSEAPPAAAATPAAPDAAPAAATGKREDVDVEALAAAIAAGPVTLLDVRTKGEYDGGHVAGAILAPIDELTPTHPAVVNLPKDKPVYVICQVGGRSSKAAEMLSSAGYWVINVKGGTGAWIAGGHPVE